MDKQSRRDAIRDYKERKTPTGVFAVRCVATGEAWVGQSVHLDQQKNRLFFALRQGGHPNPAVRAAFAAHGEAGMSFEVLETLETDELTAYGRGNLLKDRAAHWRAELGAKKLVG